MVTPCHFPSGSAVFQLVLFVQSAPPVESYSAASAVRSSAVECPTVTPKLTDADEPAELRAVIVTSAVPAATGLTDTVLPATVARATPSELDLAAMAKFATVGATNQSPEEKWRLGPSTRSDWLEAVPSRSTARSAGSGPAGPASHEAMPIAVAARTARTIRGEIFLPRPVGRRRDQICRGESLCA